MADTRALYFVRSILLLSLAQGLYCAPLMAETMSAQILTGKDAQTGLRSWEWKQAGISIQLVQRLPDQTRAFFQGRGFASADADIIGRACVFQTIFRNDGKQSMTYDLDDWQINHRGEQLALQTRERWDEKWQAEGTNQAARIAFRWSLLPARQSFEPGDYNWGMTSFGLLPGEMFDLSLKLEIDGKVIDSSISAIVCAADKPGS